MSLPTHLDYPSRTNQMASLSTYTLHATTSQLPRYLRSTPDVLLFSPATHSTCCHVFRRVNFLVRLMQPKARSFDTLNVIYDTHYSQPNPISSVAHTIPSRPFPPSSICLEAYIFVLNPMHHVILFTLVTEPPL
ncbi:hypothetical protein F4803DRAFT_388806 [Xylaria telfairii]|nr:hypothetical protein F4803DRAFT_388806 [Xylaria telfairii]